MGNLIQGQTLIYERVDDVVYARYRDEPYRDIPRWVVGGYPEACERAKAIEQGDLFTYAAVSYTHLTLPTNREV